MLVVLHFGRYSGKSSVVIQAVLGQFGIALLPRSGYTVYSVREEKRWKRDEEL